MSPSGRLEVLGVRLSPAAYALMADLVSPSGLKPNSLTRGRPPQPPPLTPPGQSPGGEGGQAVGWSGREV